MEWKINRERIPVTERILDETQEQGVELDYVLPDYDPEIFRIIRCEMQPAILEYQLQETRLSYELQVDLRILYCGSDSHRLQCVTQTMHYTKTLDLPEKPENPAVLLQAKADYANCRAVSRRRLDVRGAVSVRVQITGKYSARSRRLPTPARNSVLLKPFLYLRTSSETLQKPPFKAFFAARHGQNRGNSPSLPENLSYGVKCLCRSSIAAHPRNKPNRNPCNSRCRTAKSSTWSRLMKPLRVWLRCR